MTPERFRECLDVIGYTTREFAALLERDDRRIRRWSGGTLAIPDDVAKWLESWVRSFEHYERNPPLPDQPVQLSGSAISPRGTIK